MANLGPAEVITVVDGFKYVGTLQICVSRMLQESTIFVAVCVVLCCGGSLELKFYVLIAPLRAWYWILASTVCIGCGGRAHRTWVHRGLFLANRSMKRSIQVMSLLGHESIDPGTTPVSHAIRHGVP